MPWHRRNLGLYCRRHILEYRTYPAVRWNGLIYGDLTLFLRQLEAISVTVVISIAGTLIAIGIVKLVTGELRVTEKSESMGLDVSEHGEIAYPAFNGMDNLRG